MVSAFVLGGGVAVILLSRHSVPLVAIGCAMIVASWLIAELKGGKNEVLERKHREH